MAAAPVRRPRPRAAGAARSVVLLLMMLAVAVTVALAGGAEASAAVVALPPTPTTTTAPPAEPAASKDSSSSNKPAATNTPVDTNKPATNKPAATAAVPSPSPSPSPSLALAAPAAAAATASSSNNKPAANKPATNKPVAAAASNSSSNKPAATAAVSPSPSPSPALAATAATNKPAVNQPAVNKPVSSSSNSGSSKTTAAPAAPQPPTAPSPPPPPPALNPAALFASAAAAAPPPLPPLPPRPDLLAAAPIHGAYLGCFRVAQLPYVSTRVGGKFPASALDRCTPACRQGNHTFSAIEAASINGLHACLCASAIPPESARAPESDCQKDKRMGAAALFYHHVVASQGCRVANVPFRRENFDVHYGEHNLAWTGGENKDPTTLTVRMEGTNGARLVTSDGKHMHGVFQVEGLISDASGAVTAFYTRSSDDYNLANHGVFSEIDFEFLNGNPGTRSSLWLNSYTKGVSGGERSVPVAAYAPLLALAPGKNASSAFLTYTFSWQPDRVVWSANGVPLEKKEYGQDVAWVDMKGITYHRRFTPPDEPQHVSLSMWADGDQRRAFGGPLEWGRSPFYSSFRELRRVLCDLDASAVPHAPQWLLSDLSAELSGAGAGSFARPPQFTAAAAASAARDRGDEGGMGRRR